MNVTAMVATLVAMTGATPDGVLLNFSASWCGPSQKMQPIVFRLKEQGYAIRTVDIDHEKTLTKRFRITAVPIFVLVLDLEERERKVGILSEADLRRMLSSIPPIPDGDSTVPENGLLMFSAEWASPCRNALPILGRLEREGYSVRIVEIDQEPSLAAKFGVTAVPTFILLVDGQERERRIGVQTEVQIRRMAAAIPEHSAK